MTTISLMSAIIMMNTNSESTLFSTQVIHLVYYTLLARACNKSALFYQTF